jgi:acetyl-CoA C-acetyltransferase
MVETAENLADRYAITREAADAYSVQSHERAASAWDEGRFSDEVIAVEAPVRRGPPQLVQRDEGVRPDTNLDVLAGLRTVFPDGTVTAGNASQQNDAASACLVVAEDRLAELDLDPMAYLVGWAAAGCDPALMGIGPAPATNKLLNATGLTLEGMDLVEINEAFACQVLSVLAEWGWEDHDKLNVNGSGISLGHPIAATGARIMTTMLHEMKRRKVRYGLETMCIGGGQGIAAIFQAA